MVDASQDESSRDDISGDTDVGGEPHDDIEMEVARGPAFDAGASSPEPGTSAPRLGARRRGQSPLRRQPTPPERRQLTPAQRLLVLDAWLRSKLPAQDFAPLVSLSHHTLYAWKKQFERFGPAGLSDRSRAARPSGRLPEATQRAILMMKEAHPAWGVERISDMLVRSEGYAASASSVRRVLHEAGYESEEMVVPAHRPPRVQSFERARPNQLWQSDLFTFVLKRENRRVHLVVFLDDHSRFIVGFGLHATASGALVREVFETGVANFGAPAEVLTDNGPQYHSWRGKSAFRKLLERRGVQHLVARPKHPQTLGKTERFWGTLWREFLETSVFQGLEDARTRLGHYIDHYNFQRTHQGIDGLVPADRYFSAAPEVRRALEKRVQANAADLAQHGVPRKTFYLAGRVGDEGISLHGEGAKVILTREGGDREEVDLNVTGRRAAPGTTTEPVAPVTAQPPLPPTPGEEVTDAPAPGSSVLDEVLPALEDIREPHDEGGDA
jgi:transposase InsO family protein